MKILSVVGARPNFMKIAPFINAIKKFNQFNNNSIEHLLVHTGQHYDYCMSDSFFTKLGILKPDINLEIGSGSHAEQVGKTMIEFEKVLQNEKPDWVVVVGDVNATLACSVTAKKENIKCCHVEAGLRSGDLSMPEEINRLVTDRVSDLLLTPDRVSSQNLRNEGIPESKIVFVGNIMIDTLIDNRQLSESLNISEIIDENLLENSVPRERGISLTVKNYALTTIHRPSNVDSAEVLHSIIDFLLMTVSKDMPVIWPLHPRTMKQLKSFGLWDSMLQNTNLFLLGPLGYHEMLKLNMNARIMLTDSGGLQEECTFLGIPCLTLRRNTERPIMLRSGGGACTLVGNDINQIRIRYFEILKNQIKPVVPKLWDGKTADRCIEAIISH